MRFNSTFRARFWAKVRKGRKCWVWTAGRDARGYGRINPGGRSQPIKSHRASWHLHFGPIPRGIHVLHHCDNPGCIRPSHLFLGTHADNMADMRAKGRGYTGSHEGELNAAAKMTAAKVRRIRRLYKTGRYRQQDLAAKFGITQWPVSAIIRGVTWKHIPL